MQVLKWKIIKVKKINFSLFSWYYIPDIPRWWLRDILINIKSNVPWNPYLFTRLVPFNYLAHTITLAIWSKLLIPRESFTHHNGGVAGSYCSMTSQKYQCTSILYYCLYKYVVIKSTMCFETIYLLSSPKQNCQRVNNVWKDSHSEITWFISSRPKYY